MIYVSNCFLHITPLYFFVLHLGDFLNFFPVAILLRILFKYSLIFSISKNSSIVSILLFITAYSIYMYQLYFWINLKLWIRTPLNYFLLFDLALHYESCSLCFIWVVLFLNLCFDFPKYLIIFTVHSNLGLKT